MPNFGVSKLEYSCGNVAKFCKENCESIYYIYVYVYISRRYTFYDKISIPSIRVYSIKKLSIKASGLFEFSVLAFGGFFGPQVFI